MAKRLVSINEAVIVLNNAWGNDPNVSGRNIAAKKTIYNAISLKRLKRHGNKKFAMVSIDELLAIWGPKRAA